MATTTVAFACPCLYRSCVSWSLPGSASSEGNRPRPWCRPQRRCRRPTLDRCGLPASPVPPCGGPDAPLAMIESLGALGWGRTRPLKGPGAVGGVRGRSPGSNRADLTVSRVAAPIPALRCRH